MDWGANALTMNIIIPMAGDGKRFLSRGYTSPKPLIEVLDGKSMIATVIDNLFIDNANYTFILNKSHVECDILQDIILEKLPSANFIYVEETTDGPARTSLLAEPFIDEKELIIVNCDQVIYDFNINHLLEFARVNKADGMLGAFISSSKKNSYMKLDPNGEVIDVKEKIVISNIAANGLHFWSNGLNFIDNAYEMIKNDEKYNGEYYIAPTYNYLIKNGGKVLPFFYNLHFSLGTPDDLEKYKGYYEDI